MNLYKLHNGIGEYWVIAPHPTAAEQKLMLVLNEGEGYGFYNDRKVTQILLIAEEIDVTDKPFHLTNKYLLT